MTTLLSRLTPEHSEKLENLNETFLQERIKTALLKEYVSDLTIGEYLDLFSYVFEEPANVIELYEYFNK